MVETIRINGLALCHKHSTGWVRSTLPDICRSPVNPVCYTNIAYSRDLEDGTTTVFSHGGAMNGVKGSRFFPSYGDEPGTGGGIISGVNQHQATWLSWSPNIFMEKRAVTRLTDKMLLNRGNTVSLGGYYTKNPPPFVDRNLLDRLCKFACECKKRAVWKQRCVARKLDSAYGGSRDGNDGVWPEATYSQSSAIPQTWNLRTGSDGLPIQGYGFPSMFYTRPDVTVLRNGSVSNIVEMKFDDSEGTYSDGSRQYSRYQQIAADSGNPDTTFTVINVNQDCECDDDDKEKQKSKQPSQQPSPTLVPPPIMDEPPPPVLAPRPSMPALPEFVPLIE